MVADKNRKKISIGVEDFKEIIDRNGYFVDKTPMLAELMESNTKVTLFTRPRRFGKTLNQSRQVSCKVQPGERNRQAGYRDQHCSYTQRQGDDHRIQSGRQRTAAGGES